jgi:hypothetical protein
VKIKTSENSPLLNDNFRVSHRRHNTAPCKRATAINGPKKHTPGGILGNLVHIRFNNEKKNGKSTKIFELSVIDKH